MSDADRPADAGGRGTILVTGGAGYIGSHVVLALRDAGRPVVVIDDLSSGDEAALPEGTPFHFGDVADALLVGRVIAEYGVSLVMHFAGSVSPRESLERPMEYYRNNTSGCLALATACAEAGVRRFIFSSTAAVYGVAGCSPFDEDSRKQPTTPYGASKLMAEKILEDLAAARPGFEALSLRYFNVAGADPQGRAGPRKPGAPCLIDRAADAALGIGAALDIWGSDYETRDGSGERDYIHVSDIATVHLAGADYLEGGGAGTVLNCGYGRGFTVFEVIAALEAILGREIPKRAGPRRQGDVARAIANVDRLRSTLHWRPRFDDLDAILRSALAWRGWKGS